MKQTIKMQNCFFVALRSQIRNDVQTICIKKNKEKKKRKEKEEDRTVHTIPIQSLKPFPKF